MKKAVYVVSYLAAFLLVIGTLFKTMHWEGAPLVAVGAGMALIAASSINFFGAWRNKTHTTAFGRVRLLFGYISALVIASGMLFAVFHLPSANVQIISGSALLALVFLPLYIRELYQQNLTLEQKVATRTAELTTALNTLSNTQQQLIAAHRLSEEERKKSNDLLLNILPLEVAEELKESGVSVARQHEEVSVLFTDFVDFTGTAAQLSPQEVVQELNVCFTAFDGIMERNGLEKIKTIGDAYMAVCGLPVTDERHAQRTVQAALEIRDFIAEKAKQERAFQIRIGVNSGPVVAGIVGVKKFAYDIWGDTVNTASRMESASEPDKVNISEATYELVKEDFQCTPRGKIAAKGKGEVEMYFVTGKAEKETPS